MAILSPHLSSALPSRRSRCVEIILLLLVVVVLSYFYSGATWAVNARLNAIFAAVESTESYRWFSIDRFLINAARNYNTGDWSLHNGTFYANKAPGPILFGIPLYFALYHLEVELGLDPALPQIQIANAYILNLFLQVLIVACGAVAFKRALCSIGVSEVRAVLLSVFAVFGTLLFPYSTALWGHSGAAGFVLLGLAALLRGSRAAVGAAAFFLGCAFLYDYTAALIVAAAGALVLYLNTRFVPAYLAGLVVPGILHGAYHWICFGSPLSFATDFTNPIYRDAAHLGGLFGALDVEALVHLTVGPFRGLFLWMPVLVLSPAAIYFWLSQSRPAMNPLTEQSLPSQPNRKLSLWAVPHKQASYALLLFCLFSIASLLLLNTSFSGWHGGDGVGARYQVVAFPFWILLLTALPETKRWSRALAALGTASIVNMTAIASVSVVLVSAHSNPLYGWIYPKFLAGQYPAYILPIRLHLQHPEFDTFSHLTVWNFGTLLGLPGSWSLLPLLVLVGITVVLLRRSLQR